MNVLERPEATVSTEDELLSVPIGVPASRDGVVSFERCADLLDGHLVRGEAFRIHRHVVLLERSAEADHLHHARDLSQPRTDLPLDDRAKLLRRPRRRARQLEHVDLAQARRDGSELGLPDIRWNGVPQQAQSFVDLRAREIEIDLVREDERDEGDPEPRDAAGLDETGYAGHRTLDGLRDLRLDLGSAQGVCTRHHLNLDVRDVGDGVDGKLAVREDAAHHDERRHEEGDGGIAGSPANQRLHCSGCPGRYTMTLQEERPTGPNTGARRPGSLPRAASSMLAIGRVVLTAP